MKLKLKNVILSILCSSCIAFVSSAQQQQRPLLDSSVTKNFDAGTIAKVFNVSKYTTLTKGQQLYLAAFYHYNDSVTKAWIMQGKPIEQIDSLQETSNTIFYELNNIPTAIKVEYANKTADEYAKVATQGEMEYIFQQYKPDSILAKTIEKWVYAKYNFTYQRYLMNKKDTYSPKLSSELYDLYNFYPALYSSKFINDYLSKIKAVKKVPDSLLNIIRGTFLTAVKNNKYLDWNTVLADVTKEILPDTALFSALYKSELLPQAVAMSGADKYDLIFRQHVSIQGYNTIYDWIVQKNYENALIQFTYGARNDSMADSLIAKNSQYYDSIIKASLIRDGSLQPATQFAIGLKYKEYLKLSPAIVDSLVYHAMYISKQQDSIQLIDPFSNIDFSVYESENLNRLLTPEQYTSLLMIKNKPSAYVDANKAWADLEKMKLSQGLNKEQTVNEIANYYIVRYSAWNRLAFDSKKQMANVKTLEEVKPQILKVLESAQWNNSDATPNNELKLQW